MIKAKLFRDDMVRAESSVSQIDWHLYCTCTGFSLHSSLALPAWPVYIATNATTVLQYRVAWLFYFLYSCLYIFKTAKSITYIHPKYNHVPYMKERGSKRQHVTTDACALSARTYNAEVQGSDAWLRNHFIKFIIPDSQQTPLIKISLSCT